MWYALWLHRVDPCLEPFDPFSLHCRFKLSFLGTEQAEFTAAVMLVGANVGLALAWAACQLYVHLPPLLRSCRALVLCIDRERIREPWKRVLRRARPLLGFEAVADERVRHEFERQRLLRAKAVAHRTCPFCLAAGLYLVWGSFLRKFWGQGQRCCDYPARDIYWTYVFATGALPILVISTVAVLIVVFPCVLTTRYLDCANVLFSNTFLWRLTVCFNAAYPHNHHWLTVGRIIQVWYFGNARLSTVLHVVFLAVELANTVVRPAQSVPKGGIILRDVLVFVGIWAFTWAVQTFQWGEAQQLIEVKKSNQSSALVHQLLSHMCDVVLQLDSDLRLTEPCPGLSALLLRGGPIAKGTSFVDLVMPEDSEHFCNCLTSPSSTVRQGTTLPEEGKAATGAGAFAGLCRVRLRAANNEFLSASIFYSCLLDMDGMRAFLLGICDANSEQPNPAAVPPPASARPPALGSMPETTSLSGEESLSGWSSAAEEEDSAEPQGLLTAWVDPIDLEVLGCSRSFAFLGGTTGVCAYLSEWMSKQSEQKLDKVVLARKGKVHLRLRPPAGGAYNCTVKVVPAHEAPALDERTKTYTDAICLSFKLDAESL